MIVFIIKEKREEQKIDMRDFAKCIGISLDHLDAIERNKVSDIRLSTLEKIAHELNLKIKDLYYSIYEIEHLKLVLYEEIEKYGIQSPQVRKTSELIDMLLNMLS